MDVSGGYAIGDSALDAVENAVVMVLAEGHRGDDGSLMSEESWWGLAGILPEAKQRLAMRLYRLRFPEGFPGA